MAVLTERIMHHLAEHGASYTRQLAAALEVTSEGVRAVCRCLRSHDLIHTTDDNMHGLTAAGQQWIQTGGFLPCQRAGRAATSEGRTLRQKAWNVLRMANMATVGDLLRTVCDGDEKGAENNLRNYCRALYRAGILGKAARTGAYYLRPKANTGPKSPAYNRAEKSVTDRNTGKSVSIGGRNA